MTFQRYARIKLIKYVMLSVIVIAGLTFFGGIFAFGDGKLWIVPRLVFDYLVIDTKLGPGTTIIFVGNCMIFGLFMYLYIDFKEKVLILEEAMKERCE